MEERTFQRKYHRSESLKEDFKAKCDVFVQVRLFKKTPSLFYICSLFMPIPQWTDTYFSGTEYTVR